MHYKIYSNKKSVIAHLHGIVDAELRQVERTSVQRGVVSKLLRVKRTVIIIRHNVHLHIEHTWELS